nr:immunoglobulin heavy chain junction region [Homo sapiens]MBN4646557.1 immunoglobulin heavy chain junction region [Homo sapiens]
HHLQRQFQEHAVSA